jgi:hypothetical protein
MRQRDPVLQLASPDSPVTGTVQKLHGSMKVHKFLPALKGRKFTEAAGLVHVHTRGPAE